MLCLYLTILLTVFAVGFKQKQISVQCFTQDSEMLMPLDVDKFDKILTNLVSNALNIRPKKAL